MSLYNRHNLTKLGLFSLLAEKLKKMCCLQLQKVVIKFKQNYSTKRSYCQLQQCIECIAIKSEPRLNQKVPRIIMQGHACVFVHLILQFSSSQDTNTNTNHVQYIMYKYKEYCKDMLISMYFSSSDNTKLEAFYIVTIYSFYQENMLANFFSTKKQTLLLCFQTKVGISRWFDT